MWAAAAAVRRQQPKWLVIAVPVASHSACRELASEADQVVCLTRPQEFFAVGEWYEDFRQVSDDEVLQLLERSAEQQLGRYAQSKAAMGPG
jgi:predicted phosphoribosyltransferase